MNTRGESLKGLETYSFMVEKDNAFGLPKRGKPSLDQFVGHWVQISHGPRHNYGYLSEIKEDKYGYNLVLNPHSKIKHKHIEEYNLTIPWRVLQNKDFPVYFNSGEQINLEYSSRKGLQKLNKYLNDKTLKEELMFDKTVQDRLTTQKPNLFERVKMAFKLIKG